MFVCNCISILLYVILYPSLWVFKSHHHVPSFFPQDPKLLQLLREHVEGFAFCDVQLQQILSHAERLESSARQWMELQQRCSWAVGLDMFIFQNMFLFFFHIYIYSLRNYLYIYILYLQVFTYIHLLLYIYIFTYLHFPRYPKSLGRGSLSHLCT